MMYSLLWSRGIYLEYFGLTVCMHDANMKAKSHLPIIARVKLQVDLHLCI